MNCKLISFDLDGTLLRDDKTVSPASVQALKAAHEAGMLIVPSTGRMYSGLPAQVASLPFLDYCIFGNGSGVYDIKNDRTIAEITMPVGEVLTLLEHYSFPEACYGVYRDKLGYMESRMLEVIDKYTPTAYFAEFLRGQYSPVEDLKQYLKENEPTVNKLNFYFMGEEKKNTELVNAVKAFKGYSVTSSMPTIIEVTNINAHKGNALKLLCAHAGIDISQTAAFGDGGNDITLIREAGLGVAMSNAIPELKAAANYITLSNEEDGVAYVINKLLGGEL